MVEPTTRPEFDTMGAMEVPADALYGAQTARALENFPVSGWRLPARFIQATALIKKAFAQAHGEAGSLPPPVAAAIAEAAETVWAGAHLDHFPVDVFQTGSGTSSNMNVNEVVARIADGLLGGSPAGRRIHPNDDVNRGQSSNDVIPSALRVAAILGWHDELRPPLTRVTCELERLAGDHQGTVTLGRTHLMDAVPTTYGRVFGAWAWRLREAAAVVEAAVERMRRLPLGGTAVGSGLGSDLDVLARVVELLGRATAIPLLRLERPAAAIQAQDAPIALADALAGVGRVLFAFAGDIRLRASGPFGGLAEVVVPAVQPGSSMMPGKVNPVIAEAVAQAAIEVEGLAAACRASAALHQLELSHANPLLAWNLDAMTHLLAGACSVLADRCLAGLQVNEPRARELASRSPALATALTARLGYEEAARVARAAEEAKEPVAAAAQRLGVLGPDELRAVLDLDAMAGVGRP